MKKLRRKMTRMKRVELDSGCRVIDDDDLSEMRLTCMHWEKMRKQSGLVMNDKERKITAYHEAGHAILARLLPGCDPVQEVSIIPRGLAAGYTMTRPDSDDTHIEKSKLLDDIVMTLGGRVAEKLTLDDISTGASNDIERATEIARNMVTKYGMSDNIGMICYTNDDDEVFIGRDLAHTRSYSEGVAATIDSEVKSIIDNAYAEAKRIILEHREVLDACAELLLEKEKITRDEFEALFES